MRKTSLALTSAQERIVDAAVTEGRFATRQEALDYALQYLSNGDDLAWAKPYIDKALVSVADGKVIPAESVDAEMKAYFARRD